MGPRRFDARRFTVRLFPGMGTSVCVVVGPIGEATTIDSRLNTLTVFISADADGRSVLAPGAEDVSIAPSLYSSGILMHNDPVNGAPTAAVLLNDGDTSMLQGPFAVNLFSNSMFACYLVAVAGSGESVVVPIGGDAGTWGTEGGPPPPPPGP